MRSIVAASWLVVGCAAPAPPAAAPALAAPAAPTASVAASASSDVQDVPAPAASADAPSGPSPPASSAPAPQPAAVELEPPHLTGRFPWPEGAKERKAKLKELESWNTGGLAEGHAWHPAPRVVIGEPVLVKGKADTHELMRTLRADHYWTVRRCYDPALRDAPKLDGRAVVELVLDKTGRVTTAAQKRAKVPDTRQHKTSMSDREVVRCWLRGLTGAELPRPRTPKATVALSIDVWPGDAPLPETGAAAKPGKVELDEVARRVTAKLPELETCLVEARKERPGAWGRLALRVDIDERGAPGEIAETESTFPAASLVACATRILRELPWPAARGGVGRVTIPLRFSPKR